MNDVQSGLSENLNTFLREGYLITQFYDDGLMNIAETLVHDKVGRVGKELGIETPDSDWELANYHKFLGTDQNIHGQLMAAPNRYITLPDSLLAPSELSPIKDFFDYFWSGEKPLVTHWQGPNGELLPDNACGFRVVRPGSGDITGAHVDTYYGYGESADDAANALSSRVEKAIHGLDLITAWVPVVGFDERYSLRFAPRSHAINHPVSAFKHNPDFITRASTSEYESKFDFIRPSLKRGQAIIFHPNLLHGGSANLGNTTRVSLEIRFRNPSLAPAA